MSPILFFIIFFICTGVRKIFLKINPAAVAFIDILMTAWEGLINVYSRRSGADNPQGTKFWCQQKPLVTSVICYKFKKNLFEVWFYTIFFFSFHYFIHVYGPGAGADNSLEATIVSEKSIVLPFSPYKSIRNQIWLCCRKIKVNLGSSFKQTW